MNAMAPNPPNLPNLKDRTSRIAGLMLGARLAGLEGQALHAVGAWLDGLSAARLDAREVEPRLRADGTDLELLGWRAPNEGGGLSSAMADWIGAGLDEAERDRFFGLAARLGSRAVRWAGTFAAGGRGYALEGAASILDLELAELVVGDEGIAALTPVAEAARTEDLVELVRLGGQTTLAFPVATNEAPSAWAKLGGTVSGPLETLLEKSAGRPSLTAIIDPSGLVARGLRVPIADPIALSAALSAASVDESHDSRLAAVTAAFERALPASVELRLSASGTSLVCGFPSSPR